VSESDGERGRPGCERENDRPTYRATKRTWVGRRPYAEPVPCRLRDARAGRRVGSREAIGFPWGASSWPPRGAALVRVADEVHTTCRRSRAHMFLFIGPTAGRWPHLSHENRSLTRTYVLRTRFVCADVKHKRDFFLAVILFHSCLCVIDDFVFESYLFDFGFSIHVFMACSLSIELFRVFVIHWLEVTGVNREPG